MAGKSLVILVQQVFPGRGRKGVKDRRLGCGEEDRLRDPGA